MKPYIEARTLLVARHINETHDTIRKTAKIFRLSKSTVHYDLSFRLNKIDEDLFNEVKEILNFHFQEKHLRGGEATKEKYKNKYRIKKKKKMLFF